MLLLAPARSRAAERWTIDDLVLAEGSQERTLSPAGDLTAWGYQPNGKEWTIGIADPDSAHHPFSYLSITGMAVATSLSHDG